MVGIRKLCLSLALVALALSGCVRREIEILSTPPDATIEMDGAVLEQKTPTRFPFWWYGSHEIVVTKEGYQREVLIAHIRPPWYEHFPIDFIPDVLIPWTINDVRTFPFVLQKVESIAQKSDEEKQALKASLLERADRLRKTAREKVQSVPKKEQPKEAEGTEEQ